MNDPSAPASAALVRPFIMTGGRTRTTRREVRWEAMVEAFGATPADMTSEQMAIVSAAAVPVSIAELSALMHLPTGVVAILVEDLLDGVGLMEFDAADVEIELSALTRMIERVRNL